MAKTDLLRTIDQNTDTASFIEDQYFRPADDSAPPTPTGFSVDDAPGGVQARVDFTTDKAHLVSDFDCFILYRVNELDVNGDPIGTPVEVSRFSSATAFVRRKNRICYDKLIQSNYFMTSYFFLTLPDDCQISCSCFHKGYPYLLHSPN